MRLSKFGVFGLKFMDILLITEDTEAGQNLMRGSLDNGLKVKYKLMFLENEIQLGQRRICKNCDFPRFAGPHCSERSERIVSAMSV